MPRAKNGPVEIEYESFGDWWGETVLLVNGLGSQMTRWPIPFCHTLNARGFRVIRYDNRDVGLSTWLDGEKYALSDMADDAVAVLDATGVERAHVVGVSMGGMIVQRLAINHPDRVRSLTSIMSATGAPGSLDSTPEAAAVLNVAPPNPREDFKVFIMHLVKNARVIGSPGYPWPEEVLRDRAVAEYRRAYNPAGVARQRSAIFADGDRTEALRKLTVPAVVIHGADDPLVPPKGGEMTAAAIPGAELRMIPGMGHDLPVELYDEFIDAIVAVAHRAKATA